MNLLPACVWVLASVYGTPQPTSSGEYFTGKEYTIAIRDARRLFGRVDFGSYFYLSYKGRTITVRYTDRGPFVGNRQADLSAKTAKDLGFPGLGLVCLQMI